jgi:glucose-6-phosphate 1-dehydrogenase
VIVIDLSLTTESLNKLSFPLKLRTTTSSFSSIMEDVSVGDKVLFTLNGKEDVGVMKKRRGLLICVEFEPTPGTHGLLWIDNYRLLTPASTMDIPSPSLPKETSTTLQSGGGGGGGGASGPQIEITKTDIVRSERSKNMAKESEANSQKQIISEPYMISALSVIVVGASGDLAKKKTYPALLDLFSHGHLPRDLNVIGIARSKMEDDELRQRLKPFLIKVKDVDEALVDEFLSRCKYRAMKSYEDREAMGSMSKELELLEAKHSSQVANRLYYFAIPPNVFLNTAATIKACGESRTGFTRLIVEKPFGHDLASAAELATNLGNIFPESQIYRIDHYLGKEMVQNMLMMRFGNVLFRNMWDRRSVSSVQISFKEDFGTLGRGGYFDNYGIIRDILQNHLMQVLALVAMEEPSQVFGPEAGSAIRDAKVNVIKKIKPIDINQVVVGQYAADPNGTEPAYVDDPTVPAGSKTPTFATVVIYIDNERWAGVPFILRAGKALNERKAEVRIQLNDVPGAASTFDNKDVFRNELVIRLQPNEAVYLKATMKSPGLNTDPQQVELDLSYKERFYTGAGSVYSPDAYTRLILDTLMGKQSAFVRGDELIESWKVWDPVLEKVDAGQSPMHTYAFGSRGPPESDAMISNLGYSRNLSYKWEPPKTTPQCS